MSGNRNNIELTLTLDLKNMTANVKKMSSQVNKELKNIEKQGRKTTSSLAKGFKIVAGALVVRELAKFAKGIFDITVEFDRWNRTLDVTTEGLESLSDAQNFLKTNSEKLGVVLIDQVKSYAQLLAAAKETNLTLSDMKNIWLAVAEGSAAFQLSADDSYQAMRAIIQMLQKGTISAEELRGQLGERLPKALQVMARAVGVSTQGLLEMMENGQLLSDEVIPAWATAYRETVAGALPKATKSARAELNRLTNAWNEVRAEFARAGGFDVAVNIIKDITNIMNDPKFRESLKEIGASFGELLKVVKLLIPHLNKLVLLFGTLIGFQVAVWIAGVTKAMWGLAASMLATVGAGTSLSYLFAATLPAGGKSTMGFFGRLWVVIKSNVKAMKDFIGQYARMIGSLALAHPIIAGIVVIITALVGAFVLARKEIEIFINRVKEQIKQNQGLTKMWKEVKDALSDMWEILKDKVIPIWEDFKDIVKTAAVEIIKFGVLLIIKAFKVMIIAINGAIRGYAMLKIAMLQMQKIAIEVAKAIVDQFIFVIETMQKVITKFNDLNPFDSMDLPTISEEFLNGMKGMSGGLDDVTAKIEEEQQALGKLAEDGVVFFNKLTKAAQGLQDAVEGINVADILKASKYDRGSFTDVDAERGDLGGNLYGDDALRMRMGKRAYGKMIEDLRKQKAINTKVAELEKQRLELQRKTTIAMATDLQKRILELENMRNKELALYEKKEEDAPEVEAAKEKNRLEVHKRFNGLISAERKKSSDEITQETKDMYDEIKDIQNEHYLELLEIQKGSTARELAELEQTIASTIEKYRAYYIDRLKDEKGYQEALRKLAEWGESQEKLIIESGLKETQEKQQFFRDQNKERLDATKELYEKQLGIIAEFNPKYMAVLRELHAAELAELDAKMAAEIEKYKGNEEAKAAIEAKYRAQKALLMRQQWEEEHKMATMVIERISSGMSDMWGQLIDGTLNVKEAFKEMARSILKDLSMMIMKQLIYNALMSAMGASGGGSVWGSLFGVVASVAGSYAGGSGSIGTTTAGGGSSTYGGALSSSSSTGSGSFLGLPKAAGGPVSAGKGYLVGEKGPELFSPGTAGRITPNSKLQNAWGGGGVVVNNVVNVESRGRGDDEESKRQGKIIARQIKEEIKMIMKDEKRYGGVLNMQRAGGVA